MVQELESKAAATNAGSPLEDKARKAFQRILTREIVADELADLKANFLPAQGKSKKQEVDKGYLVIFDMTGEEGLFELIDSKSMRDHFLDPVWG